MIFNRITVVLGLLLVILAIRFFLFYQNQPEYKDGQKVSFVTTLLSEPKISGNYQRITANLASGDKIYITTSGFPEFHYGDTLQISGVIKAKKQSYDSSKDSRAIIYDNVAKSVFFPKIEAVEKEGNLVFTSSKYVLAVASFFRQKVTSFFEGNLSPTSAGLLLGIVFGIKEDLPKTFKENLRTVGVMHVVAASGMNISMVGGFLSTIFMCFFKRRISLCLTIFAIFFYALISGLEPSIVRAAIMGTLVFSSQIMGRQKLSFYILFLTAFLMLFVSPNLLFDVGFQLSFLATSGLIYLNPLFEKVKLISGIKKKIIIGEDISTTISAQISTLPVLLINFGTYSFLSVAANALVLWTIPVLMVLGGLGAIAGIVFEPFGKVFLYLALPFLFYFERAVSFFSVFKSGIEVNFISWPFVIAYYSFLMSGILFSQKKTNLS